MIGRLEGCPLSQVYSRSSTARAVEVPAVSKATSHTLVELLKVFLGLIERTVSSSTGLGSSFFSKRLAVMNSLEFLLLNVTVASKGNLSSSLLVPNLLIFPCHLMSSYQRSPHKH